MWFTENPWPPIVILGIVAAVLASGWLAQRRAVWLAAALAAVAGCAALYFVEQAIVTEGEKIEANIYRLTSAFQKQDRDTVLSFFSKQAPKWRDMVVQALEMVDVQDDLDVKDMSVRVTSADTRALSHFRANGTVAVNKLGVGFQPTRWELHWQKEGSDWKIVDVIRLDPINDNKKLGIFEPRR